MFVAWQRRPLSERGAEHYACSHPLEGPGRETIKPIVRRAFRLEGKPRNVVVARPSCAVRLCCLNDPADPLARGRFWQCARHRAKEARANLGMGACGMRPLEVELWRDRLGWLFGELAKVVPELTPDEQIVYDLWGRPEGHFPRGVELEGPAGRLEAARRRAEAYREGGRPGETPHAWWCRVDPPPRRVRVSPFDEAYGLGATGRPSPAALAALGLAWPCSADELRAAWRRAVKVAHPDRSGGSAEAFRGAKAAHDEIARALGASAGPGP